MAELYFESIHTGKRYKVVSMNGEAGTITLIGPHGVTFENAYSKELFEQMGYKPVKVEAPAPPPPPPVAAVVTA